MVVPHTSGYQLEKVLGVYNALFFFILHEVVLISSGIILPCFSLLIVL